MPGRFICVLRIIRADRLHEHPAGGCLGPGPRGALHWFGYWKLRGEANDQDKRSCRHAIQQGTRETGLRDIWELDQYRPYWARIRRLLLGAGLFNRMAELTICKDGRIVFWEV